jgi:hypothetical protein
MIALFKSNAMKIFIVVIRRSCLSKNNSTGLPQQLIERFTKAILLPQAIDWALIRGKDLLSTAYVHLTATPNRREVIFGYHPAICDQVTDRVTIKN